MDPMIELSLLQRRFPDQKISDCGKLVSDFFCARDVSSHTHEGRLFVTEKALLFVSTYSRDFDVFLLCCDIEKATAMKKGIIPSLELSISGRPSPERFTNFYNMAGVVSALTTLFPDRVTELAPSAGPVKLSRFASVQAVPVTRPSFTGGPALATAASHDPVATEAKPKVDPCPFFLKSGFCPRRLLCKLDHTHSNQNQQDYIVQSDPNKIPPTQSPSQGLCSPPKKFHFSDSADNLPQNFQGSPLLPDKNLTGNGVEFSRSISLPAARDATFDLKTDPCHSKSLESVSEPTSSVSQPHAIGSDEKTKRGSKNQETQSGPTILQEISPELPETFDFSKRLNLTSTSSENDPQSEKEEKVFVFTASSPTDDGVVKRKNAAVSFNLPSSGVVDSGRVVTGDGVRVVTGDSGRVVAGDGGRVVGDDSGRVVTGDSGRVMCGDEPGEDVVSLAQQLGLDSDNDSLQGDLDLDYQRNLLATFKSKDGNSSTTRQSQPPFSPPTGNTSTKEGYSAMTEAKLPSYEEIQSTFSRLSSGGGSSDTTDKETASNKNSDKEADKVSELGSTGAGGGESGKGTTATGVSHKRRPCIYFLSGYCRNETNCPNYHGMDLDMEELEYVSEHSDLPLPSKLKIHPASSIARSDIDSGDKIILSPQVLMVCEMLELAYPMAFKLEHAESGQVVHAGVLEFTSPEPTAGYLPQWMFDHLQAKPGDEVKFEHVELPKGTFVRLQPVSSAWLGIPYDKRLAMMEFQLRNFQTLTEGTKVTLTYELNRYTLKVLQCKPAKGISILDADITTDIVEPADFNRFHSIEEGQAEHTGLGEEQKCRVDCSTYRHFVLLSLPGQPLPSRLSVEVAWQKGDPDLFLSQTCTAPTQTRYTWCNQDVGNSMITLSADEKDYDITKPLYAGVVSLAESAEFTITFQDASDKDLEAGQTLRSSSGPSSSSLPPSLSTSSSRDEPDSALSTASSQAPAVPPPGHERCSYCGSTMPALRLLMHERHCAQSTFKCPLCSKCIPKAAEKKHHYIAHELLVCECGQEYTQLALHHHQETSCTKRTVNCPFKWCNLSFPMDQLQDHENLCARKRVPCPVCREEVSRLEMEIHLEAFHFVDTRQIEWDRPLDGQVAALQPAKPNFVCTCGSTFDFQDDLQVHQLTECGMRRITEDKTDLVKEEDFVG